MIGGTIYQIKGTLKLLPLKMIVHFDNSCYSVYVVAFVSGEMVCLESAFRLTACSNQNRLLGYRE